MVFGKCKITKNKWGGEIIHSKVVTLHIQRYLYMAMKERLFRFKQFSVRHELSAMKVGMDGVLLGTWAAVDGARAYLTLDVGAVL